MRHQPRYRMNDSQILSTFQDLPPQGAPGREEHALVFDACHVGVILRAVLFVVAVVAVGAMFGTASLLDWLARTSIVTGGALPATLAWLIAGCSLKKPLARQRLGVQVAAGVGLGALAGTPKDVIARYNQAFVAALNSPETRTRYAALMAEPAPDTPEAFGAFMKRELAKYERVVKASGAKVD